MGENIVRRIICSVEDFEIRHGSCSPDLIGGSCRLFTDLDKLHIQHLLWNIRLGWLPHPSILVPKAPQKEDKFSIADVGIGSADWLLELSQIVSPNLQLHGFDISKELFPAKEYLLSNMKLEILDAFETLPEYLKGNFDVVHIRAFIIVVKGGHPGVLLDNLIAMQSN